MCAARAPHLKHQMRKKVNRVDTQKPVDEALGPEDEVVVNGLANLHPPLIRQV